MEISPPALVYDQPQSAADVCASMCPVSTTSFGKAESKSQLVLEQRRTRSLLADTSLTEKEERESKRYACRVLVEINKLVY